MVQYVIETDGGVDVKKFFKETHMKLHIGDSLLKNPFTNPRIKRLDSKAYLVSFNISYPRIDLYGFIWLGMAYVFGFNLFWSLFPAGLIFMQGLMFQSWPYYLMNVMGLKKKGYAGKTKMLTKSEVIRRYV